MSASSALPRGAAFAMLALLVIGCGTGGPDAATVQAMHARAQLVLDRWAEAVDAAGGQQAVVPVGDLTGQVGDWELPFGDNAKMALMSGLVAAESELTAPAPATGVVMWPDGRAATVPVLSAQAALAAIRSSAEGGPCVDCTPLDVMSATLASARIATTRGPATGPVWEFAIRGSDVVVTRIAIANAVAVPTMADDPGGAVAIDAATASVADTTLTVSFTGAPDPGSQPCGEDYTADAVESDLAVTVIVYRHPNLTPVACSLVGAVRTAGASLAKPLGDRTVLDLASGRPVPLTPAP
jgi:hypothetical protein